MFFGKFNQGPGEASVESSVDKAANEASMPSKVFAFDN